MRIPLSTARAALRRRLARVLRRRSSPADLAEPDEVVRVDYARFDIRIRTTTRIERKWRAHARSKEPWTIAWLEDEVRPGDVVYDIGANVGVFSLIAAKLLGGDGHVVAFEPGYASYARLCENVALNGLVDTIVPVPLALSRSTGVQAFEYRSVDPGQSRHRFEAEAWEQPAERSTRRRPVLGIALDHAVDVFELEQPTLIKLDVDGAEVHVLEGARETLAAPSLRSVLVEIDQELSEAVPPILAAAGFSLTARHQRTPTEPVWYGVFNRRRGREPAAR